MATAIREGETLFPWVECVHVLALTLVIGSIALIDLRLIGLISRERTIAQVSAAILPITWTAFACAAVSVGLLFCSNASVYAHNAYFQAKMALILVAGVNMLIYHLFTGRNAAGWAASAPIPRGARLAGMLSLSLWVAVVACGRWIGFTLNAPV